MKRKRCDCQNECEPKSRKQKIDEAPPCSIQNIVSVIDTGTTYDPSEFSKIIHIEYMERKFAAAAIRVTIKSTNKTITGLLYKTGKLIVVGSTEKEEVKLALKLCLREIERIRKRKYEKNTNENSRYYYSGINYEPKSRGIKCGKMKISNTVYKCQLDPKTISLDEISKNNQIKAKYSPEAFPGIRIRGKYATYLVFQSGCSLILGLSDTSELLNAYNELVREVKSASSIGDSRDVVSRYIWNKKNGESQFEEPMSPTELEKCKKERERLIQSCPSQVVDSSDKFEERLARHHSFGSFRYVNKEPYDGIDSKIRDSIDLDDFSSMLTKFLPNFNKT